MNNPHWLGKGKRLHCHCGHNFHPDLMIRWLVHVYRCTASWLEYPKGDNQC